MKTIYIDSEYKCHVSDDGAMTAVETDFFDGKCDIFIEGYLYVPEGQERAGKDGEVFTNKTIAPWKPYSELAAAQAQYEADLAEAASAYQEGVDSV